MLPYNNKTLLTQSNTFIDSNLVAENNIRRCVSNYFLLQRLESLNGWGPLTLFS